MPRHRSSAVPLSWLYGALIVYASLYPFVGWRVPGVGAARLPAPRLAALLDDVRPRRQPARLPAARLPAVRRPGPRRPRRGRCGDARLRRRDAAVVDDGGRCRTTCRSGSRRTSTSPSTPPALRSASPSACCCTGAAASRSWQKLRDRWFVARSAGGLRAARPLADRPAVPDRGAVRPRPRARPDPAARDRPARRHAGGGVDRGLGDRGRRRRGSRRRGAVGDGRALDHRPRPARAMPGRFHDRGVPGWRRAALVLGAALIGAATTTLSTALNFGPSHAFSPGRRSRPCRRSASAPVRRCCSASCRAGSPPASA